MTCSHSTARAFCLDTGQRSTDSPTVSLKIGDMGSYLYTGATHRSPARAPSSCMQMHETTSRVHPVEADEIQEQWLCVAPGHMCTKHARYATRFK